MLQRTKNLMSEACVVDLVQSVGHVRKDGLVPPVTKDCRWLFAPFHGDMLTEHHCFALQGHNLANYSGIEGFSSADMYWLAGDAMGVPVVTTVLAAAISQLRPRLL